jgi:hypothetical protein
MEKALGKDDLGRVGSGAARGVGGSGKDASGVPIGELLATKGGATYVPEWDKEQVSAGDAKVAQAVAREEAGSPFAYRLTPTSSDALRRLVAIAEKLDGRALDAQGQPLDPLPLTDENNHARVVLVLPASRLEKLEGYLRSLGGLVTVVADDERLLSEDSVRVEIEVLYNP